MDPFQNHSAYLIYPATADSAPHKNFFQEVRIPIFAIILVTSIQKAVENYLDKPRGTARNFVRYLLGFRQADYLSRLRTGIAHKRTCSLPLPPSHDDFHYGHRGHDDHDHAYNPPSIVSDASSPSSRDRSRVHFHEATNSPIATHRSPRSSGADTAPFYAKPSDA